ncbi:hypothetical protein B0H14DRAFT_3131012 [Mycena olivaceomarginata]|nr:hypothetical protein B0H14DRAFT_3131012 [Mycena olivaceomarginata]
MAARIGELELWFAPWVLVPSWSAPFRRTGIREQDMLDRIHIGEDQFTLAKTVSASSVGTVPTEGYRGSGRHPAVVAVVGFIPPAFRPTHPNETPLRNSSAPAVGLVPTHSRHSHARPKHYCTGAQSTLSDRCRRILQTPSGTTPPQAKVPASTPFRQAAHGFMFYRHADNDFHASPRQQALISQMPPSGRRPEPLPFLLYAVASLKPKKTIWEPFHGEDNIVYRTPVAETLEKANFPPIWQSACPADAEGLWGGEWDDICSLFDDEDGRFESTWTTDDLKNWTSKRFQSSSSKPKPRDGVPTWTGWWQNNWTKFTEASGKSTTQPFVDICTSGLKIVEKPVNGQKPIDFLGASTQEQEHESKDEYVASLQRRQRVVTGIQENASGRQRVESQEQTPPPMPFAITSFSDLGHQILEIYVKPWSTVLFEALRMARLPSITVLIPPSKRLPIFHPVAMLTFFSGRSKVLHELWDIQGRETVAVSAVDGGRVLTRLPAGARRMPDNHRPSSAAGLHFTGVRPVCSFRGAACALASYAILNGHPGISLYYLRAQAAAAAPNTCPFRNFFGVHSRVAPHALWDWSNDTIPSLSHVLAALYEKLPWMGTNSRTRQEPALPRRAATFPGLLVLDPTAIRAQRMLPTSTTTTCLTPESTELPLIVRQAVSARDEDTTGVTGLGSISIADGLLLGMSRCAQFVVTHMCQCTSENRTNVRFLARHDDNKLHDIRHAFPCSAPSPLSLKSELARFTAAVFDTDEARDWTGFDSVPPGRVYLDRVDLPARCIPDLLLDHVPAVFSVLTNALANPVSATSKTAAAARVLKCNLYLQTRVQTSLRVLSRLVLTLPGPKFQESQPLLQAGYLKSMGRLEFDFRRIVPAVLNA